MGKTEPETLGIEEYEAFELVARELHAHFASGRKHFAVRVPQNLVSYLFTGILRKSRLPKIELENAISELEIAVEARTLRRYTSGHARMTWWTFQRLVFWAREQRWISTWVCCDLISKAQLCEVAQISARELLNERKRLVSPTAIQREEMATRFYKNLALKDLELEKKAVPSIRRYDEVRELARSLGLDATD
ncbi:hypothetical protein [Pseudomonas petrae]|uniref:hypothetical protein n=1 Tax=Pseudomonas petrae TaxID=2912190 RepID=UPI001F40A3FD|nr:hypothetical protein [Pseudomonas petrae]MCF7533934.1 hypothetical protein [Pseudomonas petrae]